MKLKVPDELVAKVRAAFQMGIPLKVISRALPSEIKPRTLRSWCMHSTARRQYVEPCAKFRREFGELFK